MMQGSKLWIVGLLAASLLMGAVSAADEIEDEYFKRTRALARDDVQGHLALAVWCRDQERWELVARECHLVKAQKPNNKKANLLLDLARTYLEKQQRPTRAGGTAPTTGPAVSPGKRPRVLTDAEVQKIRRAELQPDDRARIRIDPGLVREFFDANQGEPGFDYDRRSFFRLKPIEKALLMIRRGDERFADAVSVRSDPDRMRTFAREVSPLIAKNCATVECHGGSGPSAFQMYGGRVRDNVIYTNFLYMHEYKVGEQQVINRNVPENSLLLTYGLPPRPGRDELNHPTPIAPPYSGDNDRDYKKILRWLESLALEPPDYGVELKTAGQP